MAERNLDIVINAKNNAGKELKSLGKSLEANKATIQKVTAVSAAAFAGLTAAIGASVKSYANAGDQVHKMALRTGFSTTALSEMKHMAELSGASLETMEGAITRSNRFISDLNDGSVIATKTLAKLGLRIEDVTGESMPASDAFWELAMKIADIEDPAEKANRAFEIFGKTGTQLLPLLAEGYESMEQMREEAHRLGIVFDQEAADAAALFSDNLDRLNKQVQGVRNEVAKVFIPILTNLSEKMREPLERVMLWIRENPKLVKTIVAVTLAVTGLVAVMGMVTLALLAINPVSVAIVAGFALITAAIIGGIHFWEKIKSVTFETWESTKSVVESASVYVVDRINAFVETVKTVLTEFWQTWRNTFIYIAGVVTGLYLPTMVKMALATAVHVAKTVAQWAILSAKVMIHTLIITAKAIPMMLLSMATMVVKSVATVGIVVAQFALMAASALVSAGKMVIAWMLAFGPIGLITGLVLGVTALVIANWDKVKEATVKLGDVWASVWGSIKSVTYTTINGIIAMVEWYVNTYVSAINTVIRAINRVIAKASAIPGIGKRFAGLEITEMQKVEFGRVGQEEAKTVNVTVFGDVSGQELLRKVGTGLMGELSHNVRI